MFNRQSDRLIQLVVELGYVCKDDPDFDPAWANAWDKHWETLQACGVFDAADFNRVVSLMSSGKLLASDIERVMDRTGNAGNAMTKLYRECEQIQ